MAHLKICVGGTARAIRTPERAVLSLSVRQEGESHEKVCKEVVVASNKIRALCIELAPKDASGNPAADAGISRWHMTSLSTGSFSRYVKDGVPDEQVHHASTQFEVRFIDFVKLGPFTTALASIDLASVSQIVWSLTDATRERLSSQLRKDAVRDAFRQAHDIAGAANRHGPVVAVEIRHGVGAPASDTHDMALMGYGRQLRQVEQGVMFSASKDVDRGSADDLNFEPENIKLTCSIEAEFTAE